MGTTIDHKVIFGIDIGGTTVKCGLFDGEGVLLFSDEIPTRKDEGGSRILSDIEAHIKKICEDRQIVKSNILGIGMGIPGSITEDGVVNKCVNLGWGIFNVKEEMASRTGLKVFVGNDANVAALGEYAKGGGKGYKSMMMVTIGTGVGGGVIIDGKPIFGAHGAAGEIGHIPMVESEKETCNCGKRGCLEQVASATGIVRVASRFLNDSDEPSELRNVQYLSAKAVFDEAKAGDGLALKVVDYVTEYLGRGLAVSAGVIDPECFLIGGGVSKAGDFFIKKIEESYRRNVFYPSRDTAIVTATLGNDAGMYGASQLVLAGL